MLKSIDVLIGLSVVMLVVSMAVTVINQAIFTAIACRGRNLRRGLADMLELLGSGISRKEAEAIAEKTLSHPIIGRKLLPPIPVIGKIIWSVLPPSFRAFVLSFKFGDVIHREEFVKLLLHFGAEVSPDSVKVAKDKVTATLNDINNKLDAAIVPPTPKADIGSAIATLRTEIKNIPELVGEQFTQLITNLDAAANIDEQKQQLKVLNDAITQQTSPQAIVKTTIADLKATLGEIKELIEVKRVAPSADIAALLDILRTKIANITELNVNVISNIINDLYSCTDAAEQLRLCDLLREAILERTVLLSSAKWPEIQKATALSDVKITLRDIKNKIEAVAPPVADTTALLNTLKTQIQNIPDLAGEEVKQLMINYETAANAYEQQRQYDLLNNAITQQADTLGTILNILRTNGIDDPAVTLKKVRMAALGYEKTNPELANDVRQARALLDEASTEFLAKINLNFDQVMDRVSVRYTGTTRIVTFISAAFVAIALQLDTVSVMSRLSMDDAMRNKLVTEASQIYNDPNMKPAEPDKKAAGAGEGQANNTGDGSQKGETEQEKQDKAALEEKTKAVKTYLNSLSENGLINVPVSPKLWMQKWPYVNPAGVFLSIILLSLGAPFWYNILGKLLQMRSMLAQKDDEQKKTRQTEQPSKSIP